MSPNKLTVSHRSEYTPHIFVNMLIDKALYMGVLTFVATGLDINGGVLSYFEGTANVHCYTSCTLTTLLCSKVSFLHCCHMKRYKIFKKNVRGIVTSVRYCISSTHVTQPLTNQPLVLSSHHTLLAAVSPNINALTAAKK